MQDKDPSKRPRHPKDSSRTLSFVLAAAFFAASGGVFFAMKEMIESTNEAINSERERIQQLAVLDRKLMMIAGDAKILDIYIGYANHHSIKSSECEVADIILQSSAIDQKSTQQHREKLIKMNYLTVTDNASYLQKEQAAYDIVKAKAAQLKDVCQPLFANAPVAQPDALPEWWNKPDISLNYNK